MSVGDGAGSHGGVGHSGLGHAVVTTIAVVAAVIAAVVAAVVAISIISTVTVLLSAASVFISSVAVVVFTIVSSDVLGQGRGGQDQEGSAELHSEGCKRALVSTRVLGTSAGGSTSDSVVVVERRY